MLTKRRQLARAAIAVALPALAICSCSRTPSAPNASPAPTVTDTISDTTAESPVASSALRESSTPSGQARDNPGQLTDEQMIGQLFVTYLYGSGAETVTAAQRRADLELYGEPTPAEIVKRWHLGGIILLDHNNLDPRRATLPTGNISDPQQLRTLTQQLQVASIADSGQPLLVSVDQEGGRVQRLPFLKTRPAQRRFADLTTGQLRCSYAQLGKQLRSVGINQDLAPVADVTSTSIGVIGDRSFGPNPEQDAHLVAAAVAGLQSTGVLATLKHWPGHGSTTTDSHEALAVIHETAEQWRTTDLPPFVASLPLMPAVMIGHLALPALDASGSPASLSPILVTRLLRERNHFDGLVVTDSLWMQPMRSSRQSPSGNRPGPPSAGS
jgi:beta-N-acetylhexosaminidase